jgi:hypothetical protein
VVFDPARPKPAARHPPRILRLAGTRRIGQGVQPKLAESLPPFGYSSRACMPVSRNLLDRLTLMRQKDDLSALSQAMFSSRFARPTAQDGFFFCGQANGCRG